MPATWRRRCVRRPVSARRRPRRTLSSKRSAGIREGAGGRKTAGRWAQAHRPAVSVRPSSGSSTRTRVPRPGAVLDRDAAAVAGTISRDRQAQAAAAGARAGVAVEALEDLFAHLARDAGPSSTTLDAHLALFARNAATPLPPSSQCLEGVVHQVGDQLLQQGWGRRPCAPARARRRDRSTLVGALDPVLDQGSIRRGEPTSGSIRDQAAAGFARASASNWLASRITRATETQRR